jgi:hypothetical protein
MSNANVNRTHESLAVDYTAAMSRFKWLLPILITLAIAIFLIIRFWSVLNLDLEDGGTVPLGYAIFLAIFLSALPAMMCFVQNVSRKRQLGKLQSLAAFPVAQTTFFQAATQAIASIRLVVDGDYALPIFILFIINFVGFLSVLIAYSHPALFSIASVLLGGLHDRTDVNALAQYQMQTFAIVALAFIGSYVYSLGRILDRINNNDLYPISLYYYVARIVIACVAAAVLRQTIGVFGSATNSLLPQGFNDATAPIMLLIGFGIGFAPDLFILAMTRKAFQALKIWASREEPPEDTRPQSMPLLMIDDLTREKIDRLGELEIDSAEVLAYQNPFLLLPRLPYDLGLLVDWISQAQLYVLVRETGLQQLRKLHVRTVFDLYIRLMDDQARADVCKALDCPETAGHALLQQLDQDISFLRLREVKDAMRPLPLSGGGTIDPFR